MAFVAADRECLPIAVDPRFHSRDDRQRPLVLVTELAHFENVVGTSLDAIFFGLTSGTIDHRREHSRRLLAFGLRGFDCHLSDLHEHAFDKPRIDLKLAAKVGELFFEQVEA